MAKAHEAEAHQNLRAPNTHFPTILSQQFDPVLKSADQVVDDENMHGLCVLIKF